MREPRLCEYTANCPICSGNIADCPARQAEYDDIPTVRLTLDDHLTTLNRRRAFLQDLSASVANHLKNDRRSVYEWTYETLDDFAQTGIVLYGECQELTLTKERIDKAFGLWRATGVDGDISANHDAARNWEPRFLNWQHRPVMNTPAANIRIRLRYIEAAARIELIFLR